MIVAGSSVMLAISLFLPWFGLRIAYDPAAASVTADGPRAHGFLWIVLLLALAVLAILVTRPYLARLSGSLPSSGQMLIGATALALLLTLLGFASRPAGTTNNIPFGLTLSPAISIGWRYGAYVGVLAAAVGFAAATAGYLVTGLGHSAGTER